MSDKPKHPSGKEDSKSKKIFFTEILENLQLGGRVVSEKISQVVGSIARDVSKESKEIAEKAKETTEKIAATGAKVVDQIQEKRELDAMQGQLTNAYEGLGRMIFRKYQESKNIPGIYKDVEIIYEINEIVELEKKIQTWNNN